jgi:UMF1 family MFS transporter
MMMPAPKGSTKKIVSYALYDWASSPIPALHATFLFAVYFTTVVMPENGTFAWSQMSALSAFVVAFAAPFLGALADGRAMRKTLLLAVTVLGVISAAALWTVKPDVSFAKLALILSAINIVVMELAFVFYNALIVGVSTSKNIGRVSGFSWGLGYIGGIFCLFLALAFVLPETAPFGLDKSMAEHVRITMPLAAVWLMVFSIPFFLYVPEGKKSKGGFMKNLVEGWQVVRSTPGVLRFLIARVFYADALVTLFALGGVFSAKVFGFEQTDVLFFGILLNITAGLGAILGGILDDKVGALPTIRFSLMAMFILGSAIIMTTDATLFWIMGGALGLFVGPVQAASRSYLARLVPKEAEARAFSFMILTGKATAFIGPMIYGWIVFLSGQERLGMVVVIVLLLIGYLLLIGQGKKST